MTTTDVAAAAVDAGLLYTDRAHFAGGFITYSIPGPGAQWDPSYSTEGSGEPNDPNYSTLSSVQAANFRHVMALWDSYIAPAIAEVPDSFPGEIRIAFTNTTSRAGADTYAYAYKPPTGAADPVNGDIWVDYTNKAASGDPGSFDFQAILHEAGHTLGLKHPFENPTLPANFDNFVYTLMSYSAADYRYTFSAANGQISATPNLVTDSTPMVLDIKAVQDLYGADPNTASGNTTYTFHDADLNTRQTIYDANGIDTIDLSALSRGSHVDLQPGAYSDLDYDSVAQQVADLQATLGPNPSFYNQVLSSSSAPAYTWTNNLGLTFSTVIENVIGSAQADLILGNAAANGIGGGDGADSIAAGGGADLVYGNQGADLIYGNMGSDTLFGGQNNDVVYGGQDGDLVYGNRGDDVIYGNRGDDILLGGQGSDTLFGGQGNDVLFGNKGNDLLVGGLGADSFAFSAGDTGFQPGIGTGDIVQDFVTGSDKVDFSAGPSGSGANFGSGSTTNQTFAGIEAAAQALINGGKTYVFITDRIDGFLFTTGGVGTTIQDAVEIAGAASQAALQAQDIVTGP